MAAESKVGRVETVAWLLHVYAKVLRRQAEVRKVRARVTVLAEELKPPMVRQFTDPEGDLESDHGKASYLLSARMHRRHHWTGINADAGFNDPVFEVDIKTAAREFAREHGVQVPQILGTWPDPDSVDWDGLPDRFVLKSSRGDGGVNVYPLERAGDEYIDHLTTRPTTRAEITSRLWKQHRPDARYFAEEFLAGRDDLTGRPPNDIKVFCFYGEAVYLEVRTGDSSRASNVEQKGRNFLVGGTELSCVRPLMDEDRDLVPPDDFAEVQEAAERLSGAIRRPLVRLDFYDTDHGIVFGEITPNPGRPPALMPERDRWLGEEYENAYARLLNDVVAAGGLHLEYGDRLARSAMATVSLQGHAPMHDDESRGSTRFATNSAVASH